MIIRTSLRIAIDLFRYGTDRSGAEFGKISQVSNTDLSRFKNPIDDLMEIRESTHIPPTLVCICTSSKEI